MADEATATPPEEAAQWVDVAVMGGEVTKLDYEPGMTVRQVLEAANIELKRGSVVQINGQPAILDDVVEANSVVQVTGRVYNG